MANKKDSEAVRRARVRQLWEARPLEDRTSETGVLNFYEWLKKLHPIVLAKRSKSHSELHPQKGRCREMETRATHRTVAGSMASKASDTRGKYFGSSLKFGSFCLGRTLTTAFSGEV